MREDPVFKSSLGGRHSEFEASLGYRDLCLTKENGSYQGDANDPGCSCSSFQRPWLIYTGKPAWEPLYGVTH